MILTISDFFNPTGNPKYVITEVGTSWQYWVPLIICLLILSTLFIFKNFYLKLAKNKIFLMSLGIFQIFLYILYYFLHFLYLYYFKEKGDPAGKTLRGWPWLFPLHLSSITQILSGILLIRPNSYIFSITAPWVVIMVSVSFFLPAVTYYGPQHLSYWLFYIIHLIIVFTYWFLYIYGLVKYNRAYLLWSFISLIIFSLIALLFNGFSLLIYKNQNELTNFLFIGYKGYRLSSTITTANIFGTDKLWPLGYFFILIFGIIFLSLGHLFLSKIQPYYEWKSKTNKFVTLKRVRQKWDFASFKNMFKEGFRR